MTSPAPLAVKSQDSSIGNNIACNIAVAIQYARMRLVLDTAAMVAAIRSGAGASRRLLTAALERRFTLLASVPLMVEYQAVMTRPEHLAASGLSADDVNVVLDAVAAVVEAVRLASCGGRPSRPG